MKWVQVGNQRNTPAIPLNSLHKNITREQNKKMKVQKTSKETSKEKLQGKPAKRRKKENNPQPMYNIEKEDDNQQVTTSK